MNPQNNKQGVFPSGSIQTAVNKNMSQQAIDTLADVILKAVDANVHKIEKKINRTDLSGNKTLAELFALIYPVGSIYISTHSTSPASLFGGVWESIQDTFLLAAGKSYVAGATGGEQEHTLTTNELPKIEGTVNVRPYGGNAGMFTSSSGIFTYTISDQSVNSVATNTSVAAPARTLKASFGGGVSHNNMPPYLVVYVWKRVS